MAASRAGAVGRVHGARAIAPEAPPRTPDLHGLHAAVFTTAVGSRELPTRSGHALLCALMNAPPTQESICRFSEMPRSRRRTSVERIGGSQQLARWATER